MAAVLKFERPLAPLPTAPAPVDPVRLLPDFARVEAERCLALIRPALIRVDQGVSVRAAAKWLAASADGMPSEPTLQRWIKDYIGGGIISLAPKYKGRVRETRGWEARALELFNQPQRPAYSTVAYWLREEGFAAADNKAVIRYLKAAPSNLTETGRKRVGAHYYAQNIKPHVMRDNTVMPVGFCYEGDGHCCDVYVAHPATGRAFRPELTTWLDIRSQKVVAWWISESESAQTTLFSLSQALVAHDHVPAMVHTDPGSGFKATMISHEVTGFLVRFHIESMLALPGNAKGKGLQEGWFRWFEERCGKRFATYCGHDRTDDFLRRLGDKVKAGSIVLPTLQQYIDAVRSYVEAYNRNPQEELGCAPDDLWARLERVPLITPAEAVIRPRCTRTVRRWGVELDNRKYRAGGLAQYEQREVVVEYSMHDDDRVWIHDHAGRFVCEAQLVKKTAWLPASRIAEGQQRRLEGQRQRHLRAIDEQEARAHSPLPVQNGQPALPSGVGGHSLAPIIAPALIAIAAPRLDARTSEILAEIETDTPRARRASRRPLSTEDEIAARFGRALDVERRQQSGDPVEAEELEWLNRYRGTPEYRGQMRFINAFNTTANTA